MSSLVGEAKEGLWKWWKNDKISGTLMPIFVLLNVIKFQADTSYSINELIANFSFIVIIILVILVNFYTYGTFYTFYPFILPFLLGIAVKKVNALTQRVKMVAVFCYTCFGLITIYFSSGIFTEMQYINPNIIVLVMLLLGGYVLLSLGLLCLKE